MGAIGRGYGLPFRDSFQPRERGSTVATIKVDLCDVNRSRRGQVGPSRPPSLLEERSILELTRQRFDLEDPMTASVFILLLVREFPEPLNQLAHVGFREILGRSVDYGIPHPVAITAIEFHDEVAEPGLIVTTASVVDEQGGRIAAKDLANGAIGVIAVVEDRFVGFVERCHEPHPGNRIINPQPEVL